MQTAKTDQTGKMPRMIGVFTGRRVHFVGFTMCRLIKNVFSVCVISLREDLFLCLCLR